MSKKASPTVIGVFTLIGIIIAGATIVLFGAGKYFKSTHELLLYFDKSVYGLQVGSDVRFGGVRIGRVQSISVLVDRKENRKIIPVVVELGDKELNLISTEEGGGIDLSSFEGVEKAVSQGLRAGMKQQSLLTGLLYVEFDIVPAEPGFVYPSSGAPPYPVVPTIGTEFDELIAGIADGLKKFNAIDLRQVLVKTKEQIEGLNVKEINDNVIAITQDVRKITSDEKLASAVTNLDEALVQIDALATKANAGFDPLLADLNAIIAKTDAGLSKIDEAAREISNFSNARAPVMLRLQNVLQETERASRALKELSNDLKRDPDTLLRGKATPE